MFLIVNKEFTYRWHHAVYRISRPIYSGIRKYRSVTRSRPLDMGLCNISSNATKFPI